MTNYVNMTDVEIITSILEEHGFAGTGAFPPVPDTIFDEEAFTARPWFKAVPTSEGWDVVETTQEEANKEEKP